MIEKKACVIAKDKAHVWVEVERSSSCQRCAIRQGCGTGAVANYLSYKPARVKAINLTGAEVGDEVMVGIPENVLVRSSFMLYIMPLLVMFLSAGLGETLAPYLSSGEGVVTGLGLGGLAAGFISSRYVLYRLQAKYDFEPGILCIMPRTSR